MDVTKFSERTRKVILWSVVILLGAVLFFWWGRSLAEKFQGLSAPELPEELRESIRETTKTLEFPSVDLEIPQEVNNGATEGQQ